MGQQADAESGSGPASRERRRRAPVAGCTRRNDKSRSCSSPATRVGSRSSRPRSTFEVTPETIRRDLEQLDRNGLLRRVHGGAIPAGHGELGDLALSERGNRRRPREGPDRRRRPSNTYPKLRTVRSCSMPAPRPGDWPRALPTDADLAVFTNAPLIAALVAERGRARRGIERRKGTRSHPGLRRCRNRRLVRTATDRCRVHRHQRCLVRPRAVDTRPRRGLGQSGRWSGAPTGWFCWPIRASSASRPPAPSPDSTRSMSSSLIQPYPTPSGVGSPTSESRWLPHDRHPHPQPESRPHRTRRGRVTRGGVHRLGVITTEPGGKGVNVARAIHQAGVDVVAVVPADPTDPFVAGLERIGVPHVTVPVGGPVRANLTLTEPDGTTSKFNELGAELTPGIVDRVMETLVATSRDASWVVLSGSLPPGAPIDWYPRLVQCLRPLGVRIAVDTSDAPLQALAAALPERRPTSSSPTPRNSVSSSAATGGRSRGRRRPWRLGAGARRRPRTHRAGVATVLVTLGGAGALLVTGAGAWLATPPPITLARPSARAIRRSRDTCWRRSAARRAEPAPPGSRLRVRCRGAARKPIAGPRTDRSGGRRGDAHRRPPHGTSPEPQLNTSPAGIKEGTNPMTTPSLIEPGLVALDVDLGSTKDEVIRGLARDRRRHRTRRGRRARRRRSGT